MMGSAGSLSASSGLSRLMIGSSHVAMFPAHMSPIVSRSKT